MFPASTPLGAVELAAPDHERHGAERRPAPIQKRRDARPAERVEDRVGDENRAEKNEQRRQPPTEEHDQLPNVARGMEKARERIGQHGEEQPRDAGESRHRQQRQRIGVAHSRRRSRAEILSEDRPHDARERVDRAERHGNDPPDDRPCRHRRVTEGRDGVRHVGVADGGRDVRQHGGHRDSAIGRHILLERPDFRPPHQIMDANDAVKADAHHDNTTQQRRQYRALDAETEMDDENQIENSVGDGAPQRDVHGATRVPRRAQDRRRRHRRREYGQRRKQKLEIEMREIERATAGAEKPEQRRDREP